ncbi:MAG: glycosyltransferase [Vicinamibacterales bacterium]
MNILLVSGAIPHSSARSGSSLVLAGELSCLAVRHQVTLITFAPSDAIEQAALDHWRAAGVDVRPVGGMIPVSLVHLKRRIERARNMFLGHHPRGRLGGPDRRTQAAIDRALATGSFDIAQIENIGVGEYVLPTSLPRVLIEHEVGRSLGDDPDAWTRAQPELWRQFDRIQVFTEGDAASARAVAPDLADRLRVNPFGIDSLPVSDPALEEPATLLFVGGFDHLPNVEAAMWLAREIIPALAQRRPDVRLLLVGHAPPPAVRRLENDRITVTGGVPSVAPYFDRASVVVAPVREGGGMRRKVLEAMSRGKPVVTTTLGTEGLARSHGPLPVAIADTVSGLVNCTAALLDDVPGRRALADRARAFVARHHGWSAYADRLDAIYAELVQP